MNRIIFVQPYVGWESISPGEGACGTNSVYSICCFGFNRENQKDLISCLVCAYT
jgi:hypothetical protein